MKAINHFKQNRPVHLARRDVYFGAAAERISGMQQDLSSNSDLERYEDILFLLRVARQHARFSIREAGKNEMDEQFCTLISLLAGNVKAVLSMLNLKEMVEKSEGSFFAFLGGNKASVALQAEEYQRRANDIVRSVHNTVKLVEEPFQQLKAENALSASKADRERYEKARQHFVKLIEEGRHRYTIARSHRKIAHH